MNKLKEKILRTELLPGQVALFYIGQVGFILKFRNKYVMIDGYLSDYVDKMCSNASTKWERLYPAPITPVDLDFLDYIMCTHAHFDHTDPNTISGVNKINAKAKFIGPYSVCNAYREIGVSDDRIIEIQQDEKLCITPEVYITAIPAAHEELHPDGRGGYCEVGYIIEAGMKKIFHSGDCCPYKGLEDRIMGCDVEILPINGRDYYRREKQDIIGCFDSREAITLAKHTKAKLMVPVHWDLYSVNAVNPAHFVDELMTINSKQAFHIFVPGEMYIL